MKKSLFVIVLVFVQLNCFAQTNPRMAVMDLNAFEMAHYMAPAWNLGNTMEGGNNANNYTNNGGLSAETSWQSTKTTQAAIDYVASQGFKTVRIPCAWVMGHITDATTLTIDEAWMNRVKEITDYCLNAGMNVVINDHWDGGWLENNIANGDYATLSANLTKLWTNIANAFKDYDERVMFAGLNEPNADTQAATDRLIQYEQVFIDAVRATGGNNAKRILIVQGPNTDIDKTNDYYDITKLNDSATDRLMAEVHFYAPYQFTMMTEDASWSYMQFYWNNSSCNYTSSKHKGTYADATVTNQFKKMKTKFVDKGYPVLVGEYGSIWRNLSGKSGESQSKHNESLTYWYRLVTLGCMQYGLIPCAWDTNSFGNGSMSFINRNTCAIGSGGAQYIANGIKQGANSGKNPYNVIYPTPSSEIALKGDANNDNIIDVADITAIASYILGQSPATFSTTNADANSDGTIDVADITATATIILGNG